MQITDVTVRRLSDAGKLKGVATVTFDNEFVVRDIKIIEGESSLFIAMPSVRTSSGGFRDIAHPITNTLRERLEKAVFEKYSVSE